MQRRTSASAARRRSRTPVPGRRRRARRRRGIVFEQPFGGAAEYLADEFVRWNVRPSVGTSPFSGSSAPLGFTRERLRRQADHGPPLWRSGEAGISPAHPAGPAHLRSASGRWSARCGRRVRDKAAARAERTAARRRGGPTREAVSRAGDHRSRPRTFAGARTPGVRSRVVTRAREAERGTGARAADAQRPGQVAPGRYLPRQTRPRNVVGLAPGGNGAAARRVSRIGRERWRRRSAARSPAPRHRGPAIAMGRSSRDFGASRRRYAQVAAVSLAAVARASQPDGSPQRRGLVAPSRNERPPGTARAWLQRDRSGCQQQAAAHVSTECSRSTRSRNCLPIASRSAGSAPRSTPACLRVRRRRCVRSLRSRKSVNATFEASTGMPLAPAS